jgi:hypothetical protein
MVPTALQAVSELSREREVFKCDAYAYAYAFSPAARPRARLSNTC